MAFSIVEIPTERWLRWMGDREVILICRCAERGLLEGVDELIRLHPEALVVEDLCALAAGQTGAVAGLEGGRTPSRIYACHQRAVRALCRYAGFELAPDVEMINLRRPDSVRQPLPEMRGDNPAWFPVIDQERCSQCGQCFEFCLFGVYEKGESGDVVVANPLSCKNNCPACARICPEAAILFPKAGEEPINGADISDEEGLKAMIQLNVDALLGDDVYAALHARKVKRRQLLNQKRVEKALEERRRCSDR
jgi:NAD-dependent dihydropyrimidine dehydrogenase PreA subunit